MKKLVLAISILLGLAAQAQEFNSLQSGVDRTFQSKALGKAVNYTVYVPKTIALSDDIRYPVAYVFDRQNSRGCTHTVQSMDYLMSSFALPTFIVVTIAQEDRLYETSTDLGKSNTGGIEPFLDFVLEELDSALVTSYRANSYRMLIGHSRTAFMTTYALATRPQEVHAVIANSPFFTEPAKDPKIDLIAELDKMQGQLQENRFYSFSYGGDGFDAHYDFCTEGEKRFTESKFSKQLQWEAKTYPYADHYTVVGMHTINALASFSKPYASILARFLDDEDKAPKDVEWLKAEFEKVSSFYGMKLVPDLVHINSMASHYWQLQDYEQATWLLQYGLELYPKDADLHSFLAAVYQETKDNSKAAEHYQFALEHLDASPWYNNEEKQQLREEIEGILNTLD